MKRSLILSIFLCFVAVFGSSRVFGSDRANTKEVVLKVEGMTCKMCPISIRTALRKVDGVVDAKVSFKDKKAWVLYREDKVDVEDIVKAVENAGNYKAIPIDNNREE